MITLIYILYTIVASSAGIMIKYNNTNKNIPSIHTYRDAVRYAAQILKQSDIENADYDALELFLYVADMDRTRYLINATDELKKDIMNKKAECGYVFGENLSEKILNNTYEGSVELIVNSSDFIASMTNEMVFAAMFKNFAPDVAKEYLKKSDIFSRN